MPTRSERSKEKKFVRTPGGVKIRYETGKSGKHHCARCKTVLHGVPHGKRRGEIAKLSKSEKRPSVIFGGVLCGNCRKEVIEDAAKIKAGFKEEKDVDLEIKKFVEIALRRVE
jgi:ribosomal protein L34E